MTACSGPDARLVSEEVPQGVGTLATAGLMWGSPIYSESGGSFEPMTTYTADYLNEHKVPSQGPLVYVDADVPSTGPTEVSVNAIDAHTWGAASLSSQDGFCYLMVDVADRENPTYGNTLFGKVEARDCVGSLARPDAEYMSEVSWNLSDDDPPVQVP